MSSEWKNRLLSEIVEINPKRTIKKGETTPFIDMAALPINSRDVNVAICSREYKGGGSKFQNGDTLVARITPCLENGKTALINCLSDNTIAHGSTEFIVLAARDQREFQFVYYLARSDPFRSYAIARMEGTSGRQRVPNIAVGDYEFFCPPADQRVAIGRFLANLDDRITLLREINKTLEAIAQAIFKSWFVDFDPVRAKMEGRQPEGMDEATAALFPDSFEESELGLVPKGWKTSSLAESCSYLKRGLSPKYLEKGGVLVLNQKCVRDFSIDFRKARRHDNSQRAIDGRTLEVGDVVVNSTGVGTLGRVAQVLDLPETTIADSHLTIVRAGSTMSPAYLGEWMQKNQTLIESMGEGTTGQTELSRAKLGKLRLLAPPSAIQLKFSKIVQPLKSKSVVNSHTSASLEAIRDTLLPRLISGQLRLPEAQEQIENALT